MAKDDKPPMVTVCKEKKGEYQIKLVKPDKVDKHLANHDEDGVAGGPVPGMDGYNFGPDCVPVPACTAAAVKLSSWMNMGKNKFLELQTVDGTHIASSSPGNSADLGQPVQLETMVAAELLPGAFTIGVMKPNGQFVPRTATQIHLDCGANFSATV